MMLETVFITVLRMTMEASLVILAVLLLRFALKGAPKAYACGLWLLVLLRLLCPVFPEVSISPMPEVNSSVELLESFTSQTPVFDAPEAAVPVEGDAAMEAEAAPRGAISLQALLSMLWAVGTVSVLAWGCLSLIPLGRKLQAAVPKGKGVYLADHIDTPFVMGVLRPKIYLPSDLPEDWMDAIVRHERCHIRHLDPLVKHLFFLATAIHWFNPLVWVAYRFMGRDMEMRCDEAVMKEMDEASRREYAQSLLCLSTGRRRIAAPLAFGEGDTRQRIKEVLQYKKPAFWLSIAGAALCVLAAVFLLTNPVITAEYTGAEVLEFPGVPWLSSPDEVKEILDIGPEDIVNEYSLTEPREDYNDVYAEYTFAVSDQEVYGQRAETVIFRFWDPSWTLEEFKLYQIDIYYPDGYEGETADLEALQATLTELYGPVATEYVYRTWYPGFQEIRETRSEISSQYLAVWNSERTTLDFLTAKQEKAIYNYMVVEPRENAGDANPYWIPSQEEYMTVLDTSLASMSLRGSYGGTLFGLTEEGRAQGATDYVLTMDANAWVSMTRYIDLVEQ